ncbi:2Fe-2S iron-sulfur cluster-binding protein [Niallia sp. Krafla_26]|uniref:2Fe-2S iron-sulfur cluster-binding protein n=1 Tax=Niallia sp. Krafla_26 TaxID=3064703 RepID=UPI003D176AA3
MFRISIDNEESFLCSENQTLLEAARSQMVKVPYACTRGGCGFCKAKVMEGAFRLDIYAKSALSDEEVEKKIILLCKTYAESDLQLTMNL